MRTRTASCLTLLAAAVCSTAFARNPQSEKMIARPSWATAERFRGRVEGTAPVALQVHLKMRNLEEAKAELEAVSDPDSPRYGKYLTSEEFEAKYAPTEEDLAAVRAYLESEGFTVTYVPHNRQFVSARAPASEVERVFATRLGRYEVERGDLRRSPIESARVPDAMASRVSAVLGLATARVKPSVLVRSSQLNASKTSTFICANFYGQYFDTTDPPYGGGFAYPAPVQPCGLTPVRVRRTYGLDSAVAAGNNGHGVTIAVVDAWRSPTLVSDAQAFAAQFDPQHPLLSSQISVLDAPSGGDPTIPVNLSWYYEQLLDVESVHSVAPGAKIVYIGAATDQNDDMTAAFNLAVENKLASIISNSYGSIEDAADGHQALDPIILQAGLEGIGVYFATGDCGDNQVAITFNGTCGLGTVSVGYPASNPNVTAVGGTSLFLDAHDEVVYETGWESGDSVPAGHGTNATWEPLPPGLFFFGGGGGPSQRYAQPKYQRNIVPSALAGTTPVRVLPDVAMLADLDSGAQLGLTDPILGVYTVYLNAGGTSLATPLFAATMALAEQRAGHRLGFANPKLYRVYSTAFRDIVPTSTPQSITQPGAWQDTEDPPNLQVMRPDGTIHSHTLHSAPGFDNVTGLGVPAGEQFLEAVASN